MDDFRLRPLVPGDAPALAALLARSADTGRFRFSSRFVVDPWTALGALHGTFDGVVAEVPGEPGLAGCGLVRYGHCRYEGEVRPFAFLNTLVVDPARRRRGLAGRLVDWRVDHARQRAGPEAVLYAGIQGGNVGSERAAARWARQVVAGRLGVHPTPARARPPAAVRGLGVHAATPDELAAFAAGLEAFHARTNFHAPETAASLAAWRAWTPFDAPWRELFVVLGPGGEVRAGLGLAETARVRETQIVHVPLAVRLLNPVIGLVPRGGRLREVAVSRFWFAPGHAAAARHLWESVRWAWRDRGTTFMAWSDTRLPLVEVLRPRAWRPRSTGRVVVAGPVPLDESRPLEFT